MGDINEALELYKVINETYECGWVDTERFFIWVGYYHLSEFMQNIIRIFGRGIFEDGISDGVVLMEDDICIDLTSMLSSMDMDFEKVFPKEKYQH